MAIVNPSIRASTHVQNENDSPHAQSAYPHNHYMTLASLADVIKTELQAPNPERNYMVRMVAQAMSHYRALTLESDQDAFLAKPGSTGDIRWDAMIAATAEREARLSDHDIPEWCLDNAFILRPWWFLSPRDSLRAYSLQHAAPEYRFRNVLIDANSLESV